MSVELYYTAPSQPIFNEIKREALKIWKSYDDTFGYASGKIRLIKDLENVDDNYMYIYCMFDRTNQDKLFDNLSEGAQHRIKKALLG